MDSGILSHDDCLVIILRTFCRFSTRFNCRVKQFSVCLFVTSPALIASCVRCKDMCVNMSRRTYFPTNSRSCLVSRFAIPNVSWSRLNEGVNYLMAFCSAGSLVNRVCKGARSNFFSGRALCFVWDPNVAQDEPCILVVQKKWAPLLRSVRVLISDSRAVFPRRLFPFKDKWYVFRCPFMSVRNRRLTNFLIRIRLARWIFGAYVSKDD